MRICCDRRSHGTGGGGAALGQRANVHGPVYLPLVSATRTHAPRQASASLRYACVCSPTRFSRSLSPPADTAAPQLFLTTGELDRQKGPAVFFLRTTKPGVEVVDSQPEQSLSFGTLPERAMEGLQVILTQLYQPMVDLESKGWKPGVGVDDSTAEFFSAYSKFGETLGEAVSSLQGGFTLRRPDNLFDIENKAAAFNRAGGEPHIVKAFEDVADEWCTETEKLLAENDNARAESDDAGPETELEYWRTRMAKFNAITEQVSVVCI